MAGAEWECSLQRRAHMPAYIQYHRAEPTVIVCPTCLGLPLHIRDVEPVWSAARFNLIYECDECGGEVRTSVTRSEQRH
jgi:hypothetical protein